VIANTPLRIPDTMCLKNASLVPCACVVDAVAVSRTGAVPDRPDDAGGATRGRDLVITEGSTEQTSSQYWKRQSACPLPNFAIHSPIGSFERDPRQIGSTVITEL
jgi:hypothetical protein